MVFLVVVTQLYEMLCSSVGPFVSPFIGKTRIYDAEVGIVFVFEGVNGSCMPLPIRLQ